MNKELVFLLHGLYMNPLVMSRFSRLLRAQGYIVENIDYNSINIDTKFLFNKINKLIKKNNPDKTHFIGHSLGGLLVRQYLYDNSCDKIGRVITIGTPHQTASIAKRIEELNIGFILGNSKRHGLIRPLDDKKWEFTQELGTISGTKSLGARSILFPKEKDIITDGTITLEESRIEGSKDRIEFNTNHTGLIYSRPVINASIRFLKNGYFNV